jgi:hypothetical protein
MKKTFKDLRDQQVAERQRAAQLEEDKLKQQREQAAAMLQQAQLQHEQMITNDNYQKELDRINKKEIAIIQATGFGQVGSEDANQNAVPDVMEINKFGAERDKAEKDYQLKLIDIQSKAKQSADKLNLEKEKLQVARENMQNDLQIAEKNAKNRASKSKSK